MATATPIPVLQKPPGFRDPNGLPARPAKPVPRKVALPPSFNPKKKRRNCCPACYCCCCVFLLILVILIVICGIVFFFWFDPKLPTFHIQSFRFTRFNVTSRTDGQYLDAQTVTRIEVRNPNEKISFYYGATEVDVSVGEGDDQTELGTARLPAFTQKNQITTSLKIETKVDDQQVNEGTGDRLLARFGSKNLAVKVEVRTKVGVGVGAMKFGKFGVTVTCRGATLKELNGSTMPKCDITLLRWITIHA
ncbi:hypothetical protein SLE2022_181180 [Rubroshorea leprosula]